MKILFYDTKPIEENYFKEKFKHIGNIEAKYYNYSLLDSTYIDSVNQDCEALSIFVSSYLTKEVLEKFKHLKFIFLRCVGYSNVDLEYCKNNGIKIFNTPNYGNSTVAEYAFALLLEVARKVVKAKQGLLDGVVEYDDIEGIELDNKTLGIIGYGAIGKKVEKIALGFNMNVLIYDIQKVEGINYVEFDELIKNSDFISINCPLTNETRGLISKNEFDKMKNSAIIINTARGEIINTDDLYEALISKKIKGCALDVVECEEMLCEVFERCKVDEHIKTYCLKKFLFISKLMKLDNVIVTPHNAYNTNEARKRILDMTFENINASFDLKSSPKNLVLI